MIGLSGFKGEKKRKRERENAKSPSKQTKSSPSGGPAGLDKTPIEMCRSPLNKRCREVPTRWRCRRLGEESDHSCLRCSSWRNRGDPGDARRRVSLWSRKRLYIAARRAAPRERRLRGSCSPRAQASHWLPGPCLPGLPPISEAAGARGHGVLQPGKAVVVRVRGRARSRGGVRGSGRLPREVGGPGPASLNPVQGLGLGSRLFGCVGVVFFSFFR